MARTLMRRKRWVRPQGTEGDFDELANVSALDRLS